MNLSNELSTGVDSPAMPESLVIFVDMLGFRELVLNNEEAIETLQPSIRYTALNERFFNDLLLHSKNPLQSRFSFFHQALDQTVEQVRKIPDNASLVFSDCAFFKLPDLVAAVTAAIALQRELVKYQVPARFGLARGSMKVVRFLTDSVTGSVHHSSQFLGTGVVRAFQTESCGVPGLRILVHPEVVGDLSAAKVRMVEIDPPGERHPGVKVTHELNYLLSDAEFESNDFAKGVFKTVEMFDQEMIIKPVKAIAGVHQDKRHIYDATLQALNKMRMQFGRDAV